MTDGRAWPIILAFNPILWDNIYSVWVSEQSLNIQNMKHERNVFSFIMSHVVNVMDHSDIVAGFKGSLASFSFMCVEMSWNVSSSIKGQ